MEQICATQPGAAMPTEKLPQNEAPGITSSAKMKKAPSLQSLRLVSPQDLSSGVIDLGLQEAAGARIGGKGL